MLIVYSESKCAGGFIFGIVGSARRATGQSERAWKTQLAVGNAYNSNDTLFVFIHKFSLFSVK